MKKLLCLGITIAASLLAPVSKANQTTTICVAKQNITVEECEGEFSMKLSCYIFNI